MGKTLTEIIKLESGLEVEFFFKKTLDQQRTSNFDLRILSDMCRLNILSMIKCAGSGHLGSSLSSIDIMIAIRNYLEDLKIQGFTTNFFSSKGHDAPAFYSMLHLYGDIPDDYLSKLRRIDGLPGHPEIHINGVDTNSGSLGMGISKSKGLIYANRLRNSKSKVICILGDGELQEGQIWEAMPGASRDALKELVVVVDGNKIQSDTWVSMNFPTGNLKDRVESFGWIFLEADGHDFQELSRVLKSTENHDKPTFIYCNTIKGKGFSLMEHFPEDGKFYPFHSGSISDNLYFNMVNEIKKKLGASLREINGSSFLNQDSNIEYNRPKDRPESLVTFWSDHLLEIGATRNDIVVLDGDLTFDTGTWKFADKYGHRYLQCGIAEQDMVSLAGGIALKGITPIVHSFATFLTMRAAEQIFNNCTEGTKIIYVGFLAGILPAAPGFSHQAVNDVGIMATMPNLNVISPSTTLEFENLVEWSLGDAAPSYFRIGNIGNPRVNYQELINRPGEFNSVFADGQVAIVVSSPFFMEQALSIRENLRMIGIELAILTYPFLNSAPTTSALESLSKFSNVLFVEDFNSNQFGFNRINSNLTFLSGRMRIGVDGLPRNGRNDEVLQHHSLDQNAIMNYIRKSIE